jgi:ATP-dependent Clp protease ATP-binding subunit ClpC
MFERFTDEARRVVVVAQEQAREMQHAVIGSDHLLSAMLVSGSGVGAAALGKLGVTGEQVREISAGMRPSGVSALGHIPFDPGAKKVLELALREALALGHNYIGTEHLLLGMLRESDGKANQVLGQLGVEVDKVRAQVLEDLNSALDTVATGNEPFNREERGNRNSQTLDSFGKNLTAEAQAGRLDPVIGREAETERLVQILARRTKNNPILIGEPGVGKTAVVEGLAQAIANGTVPARLAGKQVYSLDLGGIVAGTRYRGDFEERIKKLLQEAQRRNDVILFIDEIHTLVGAGSGEGAMDAANILKPLLARGDLQVIGATTIDEFRKHIEKDAALERRFQSVTVEPPTVDATISILLGLRERYATHHKVTYTDGALESAARLADRYISDRFLPDKAIDVIDEAGARAQVNNTGTEVPVIDVEEVSQIVAKMTGVPVSQVGVDETSRLLDMEGNLSRRVIGQSEAIRSLAKTVRRTRAGLKDPKRPSGSFIFAGPSGVGKTELAKTLAEFLFGDEAALISLDMSEYSEKHSVARLFGSPPGYVGYEDGGQLTERVRRRPFSVVLFDEIEKAHPEVFNSLLQVLEEGRLTDSQGRSVDFRNTVLIMTTNLGTAEISKGVQLGFASSANPEAAYDALRSRVNDALKQHFRPEFLNRVDDTIVFPPLTEDEVVQICTLMVAKIAERLALSGIGLELTPSAKLLIGKLGYDATYGARPLRRVLQRRLEDPLSERLLSGTIRSGQLVAVDAEGDNLTFTAIDTETDVPTEPVA